MAGYNMASLQTSHAPCELSFSQNPIIVAPCELSFSQNPIIVINTIPTGTILSKTTNSNKEHYCSHYIQQNTVPEYHCRFYK